jgi:hypothetical protein
MSPPSLNPITDRQINDVLDRLHARARRELLGLVAPLGARGPEGAGWCETGDDRGQLPLVQTLSALISKPVCGWSASPRWTEPSCSTTESGLTPSLLHGGRARAPRPVYAFLPTVQENHPKLIINILIIIAEQPVSMLIITPRLMRLGRVLSAKIDNRFAYP